MHEDLSPAEFLARRVADGSWQLLDVREPSELESVSVPGSIHIPLQQIPLRLAELDMTKPLAVLCHSGGRSARAAEYLAGQGFARVANIAGGIDAWERDADVAAMLLRPGAAARLD